ncbi:MAG TPA: flagellar protein [Thermotogaceae bacterium]|nr:flagellar FlbD family protein [Thermotogota bacterium]HEW91495.1 flagellar protein [Thermotogaceae bacterium]
MIHLTQMNGTKFVLNAEMIELIESTPNTVITLINGRKLIVLESVDEVVDKVIEYKKKAYPVESLLKFLPEIRR